MIEPSLVVLAAGLSTRYGRLKQLEPIGPAGECLLDFTLQDASLTGFGDAVIVVRDSTVGQFIEHFDRYPPAVPVRLSVQDRDGRAAKTDGSWRPWGTAHAVLSAAPHIRGPFGVANADDHYGRRALERLAEWGRSRVGDAALIAFRLDRTLSDEGGVSRAVCQVADGWLTGIVEVLELRRTPEGIVGREDSHERTYDGGTPVSMNLWGFAGTVPAALRVAFEEFRMVHDGDAAAEYRIPDFVDEGIRSGAMRVRVIDSGSSWSGLTFPGDREGVERRFREAVAAGRYPRRETPGD